MTTTYALFDFDGTITSSDSCKMFLLSATICRPICFMTQIGRVLEWLWLARQPEGQDLKNVLIGHLLAGATDRTLNNMRMIYSLVTRRFMRSSVVSHINELKTQDVKILVVTASPQVMVEACFEDDQIFVVGTKYKLRSNGVMSQTLEGPPCYGVNKLAHIKRWSSTISAEVQFIEAWSDCESDLPMMMLSERRYWVAPKAHMDRFQKIDPDGMLVEG